MMEFGTVIIILKINKMKFRITLFFLCLATLFQASFAQTITNDSGDEVIPIRRSKSNQKVEKNIIEPNDKDRGHVVVLNYIKAIGGEDILNNLNSFKATYSSSITSKDINTSEDLTMDMLLIISYYSSEKYLIEVIYQEVSVSKQFVNRGKTYQLEPDGTWTDNNDEISYKFSPSKSVFVDYDFLLSKHKIDYKGVEEKNGVTCYKIEVPLYKEYIITSESTSKKSLSYTNYYRVDNNLLYISELHTFDTSQVKGEVFNTVITTYGDYKSIEGILFPHSTNYIMETAQGTVIMNNLLQKIVINPTLEDIKL